MNQNRLAQSPRSARRIPAPLIAVVLWLVSVGSTVAALFATREIIIWGVALVLTKPNPTIGQQQQIRGLISLSSQCGIIVFGLVAIAIILYGGELIFHRADQPRTVRWLVRAIALECLIIAPVFLLVWRT